jgi:hypothetical protein
MGECLPDKPKTLSSIRSTRRKRRRRRRRRRRREEEEEERRRGGGGEDQEESVTGLKIIWERQQACEYLLKGSYCPH